MEDVPLPSLLTTLGKYACVISKGIQHGLIAKDRMCTISEHVIIMCAYT